MIASRIRPNFLMPDIFDDTAPSTSPFVAIVKPSDTTVPTTVSRQIMMTRRCTHFDQRTTAAIPGLRNMDKTFCMLFFIY